MTTLRELAQWVLDAYDNVQDVIESIECRMPNAYEGDRLVRWSAYNAAAHAFGEPLGADHHKPAQKARAFIAALDAEREAGRREERVKVAKWLRGRAEYADGRYRNPEDRDSYGSYREALCDAAWEACAEWDAKACDAPAEPTDASGQQRDGAEGGE